MSIIGYCVKDGDILEESNSAVLGHNKHHFCPLLILLVKYIISKLERQFYQIYILRGQRVCIADSSKYIHYKVYLFRELLLCTITKLPQILHRLINITCWAEALMGPN